MKKKMTKRDANTDASVQHRTLLKEGDWIDVLDGDGVWNVARVIGVLSWKEVKIHYDGWPNDYDEVVSIDSNRVAPYHTFTWSVKCWVKYLNWPLWPSLITIRTPGTVAGINNLSIEDRVYVDFLDNTTFGKRDRCWQKVSQIRAFGDNFDRKRAKSTGASFEKALARVLQSEASSKMPEFAIGTLLVKYKSSPAKCVETLRKSMGDELWFQHFTYSRKHHAKTYVYETTGGKAMKEGKSQVIEVSEKKSLVSTKIQHKLERMESSESSEAEDNNEMGYSTKRSSQKKQKSDDSLEPKAKRQNSEPFVPLRVIKTSKALAQLPVEESRSGCVKGKTKKGAKRPVRESAAMSAGFELMHLGMSSALESDVSNHNEEGEEHGSPAVAQSRMESERSVARYPSKRSRMNDPETLLDRDIKVKGSKQVKVNKRQAAANKKNQEMVGTEGQKNLAFEKATVCGRRVEQIGRKLHGAPESVASYHNSNRVKQPIANPSDNDAFVSSILSKFQEGAEIVDKNRSPSLGGSPHSNRGNNLSQELRGRSCVMHAGHKDVDAAKNVKCSNKTVISMPRRFQEYSVPRMFNCGTSSSAPPGPGCSYSDAALAASTPVFSSSNSFSMKSWFKRLDGRFH